MPLSASLDSRLIPFCLAQAGASPACLRETQSLLAALLSGRRPSPASLTCEFADGTHYVTTFILQWDSIKIDAEDPVPPAFAAALTSHGDAFSLAAQDIFVRENNRSARELDAALKALNASLDGVRHGTVPMTLPIAQALIATHEASINRVLHEEIVGLMTRTVSDRAARLALGQFLLAQFPLPARRTHRFSICQALSNVAEPELADGLAALARDDHFTSLSGRLCEALAHTGHPNAAAHIAAALEHGDDETKLCAIEALGQLKAKHYAETVRGFLLYQSADKEWTRSIKKAAEKALKKM